MERSRGLKNPSVEEKRLELESKMALLEAEEKVHDECHRQRMEEVRARIHKIEQENDSMSKRIAELKDPTRPTREALLDRPKELRAYGHLTLDEAIDKVHDKNLRLQKQINALNAKKKTETEKMKQDVSRPAAVRQKEKSRRSELEEKLEKKQLECEELRRVYAEEKRLTQQAKESTLTLENRMIEMEKKVQKKREDVEALKSGLSTAQHLKKQELAKLDKMQKHSKEQERLHEEKIDNLKKKLQELKDHNQELERQHLRSAQQKAEEDSKGPSPRTADEEEEIALRETCLKLMRVTGAARVTDLAKCFAAQKERLQRLEDEVKEKMKMPRQPMKEDLFQKLQDMKVIRVAEKVSSDKKTQVKVSKQLVQSVQREPKLETLYRLRLEGLADRLKHIKLPEDRAVEVSPDSEDYLSTLKTECDLKMQILRQRFEGKDIDAIQKRMEESNFLAYLEKEKQEANLSALPQDESLDDFEVLDDSAEDDPDILTREQLKAQSQKIVDFHSKRRQWQKKKGK
ncbi:coiled-coil domain-containing protein 151 [Xyrichtys novacula]|uniref:Coiled-coil domain-containing protein 151 n=1 Tax=Xyrichtys novacula TaxID=13765 RepID=A0AAV1EX66_XYRNO|nr:coiled-coil domain-containing protein 151 [Xyrichtys novacula]